jgi:PAS domain S-box-containing protein
VWAFLFPANVGGQAKPIRRVLILNEVDSSFPLIRLVDEGIRATFANAPYRIEFYRESLDTELFPDPADQQLIRDFYIRKYQGRRLDVIITVGSSPLNFILQTHQKSFPGVPVVFSFPSVPMESDLLLHPDITGVEGDISPAGTIDAALRLLPDTRHVVVVGGVIAPYDIRQQAVIKEQLKSYQSRLDISYLPSLTIPSLLKQLNNLPSHSIVLLSALGRDAAGTTYTSSEMGPLIVGASNAPVFSISDRHFNHGEVGGDLSSAMQQGTLAGGLAIRLLNGERGIPPITDSSVYMFDWRALKRWGLKEKNLPPGSIVVNRQPGFWEQYKRWVLPGIFVLLAQMVAILGLLLERARRRKMEAELRKSEEKFSKSFRQSPLAILIVSTIDGRYLDVNETFEEQTGWRRDEVIGRNVVDIHLWVDREQTSALIEQLLANGNLRDWEIPVRRRDGEVRMALGSAELIEVNGQSCVLSVVADITDRKRAEEALSSVSRRLIEAQEAERTRIARELHDDIDQRIAMVAVRLKTLKRGLPASEIETIRSIEEACGEVSGLEKDIQALSRRLHSSKLEYLGVEAASAAFCHELSEKQNVKINFRADDIPEDLPHEISLCLYRVLQEALHNAVKHSGVSEFEVSLTSKSGEIQLVVHDAGVGFDFRSASLGHGLGLTSMRERLKLVDGRLVVESKTRRGTTIVACVALPSSASKSTDSSRLSAETKAR